MSKLPVEEKEVIVDVDLKHLLVAFGGIAITIITISTGIIILRDYAKYKRQKAIIDGATKLIFLIRQEEPCESE